MNKSHLVIRRARGHPLLACHVSGFLCSRDNNWPRDQKHPATPRSEILSHEHTRNIYLYLGGWPNIKVVLGIIPEVSTLCAHCINICSTSILESLTWNRKREMAISTECIMHPKTRCSSSDNLYSRFSRESGLCQIRSRRGKEGEKFP